MQVALVRTASTNATPRARCAHFDSACEFYFDDADAFCTTLGHLYVRSRTYTHNFRFFRKPRPGNSSESFHRCAHCTSDQRSTPQ
ncbi:uncharacterized protein LAESUDRAFT_729512 [Laetiporus sulphureus 93-53]|uniref:Uncharacterized protein n=1 Tax=Laetiporus sulphureus 93-53 TaxID=1314785 RepID=A0A165CL31_9APHY|nr:uncharacterized protein LAESUDRAFT_729512 [Laetiporus sulphureus 93-53]KZT03002.1 hypothetical protein LAESUDRAFT_729512 [Laetiporus sulphureus 93-53]